MTVLLVAAAAGAGAAARYLLDTAVTARTRHGALPWGTLAVNTLGSLLAGLLLGLAAAGDWPADVGVVAVLGFLGSFTTFSTFAYETVALALDGSARAALRNVAANVVLCVAAASLALGAVTALAG